MVHLMSLDPSSHLLSSIGGRKEAPAIARQGKLAERSLDSSALPLRLPYRANYRFARCGGPSDGCLHRSVASTVRYCWRAWRAATSLLAAPLKSMANQSTGMNTPATPAATFWPVLRP